MDNQIEIITLCGFSGVGKTTIGKYLSDYLSSEYNLDSVIFIDLDEYIKDRIGTDIKNYFHQFSEKEFRKREYEALKEIITHSDNLENLNPNTLTTKISDSEGVESSKSIRIKGKKGDNGIEKREFKKVKRIKIISLGGGSLEFKKSRELVKNHTLCIYLSCTPKLLSERLSDTKEIEKRPIISKMLKDEGEMVEKIALLLNKREKNYLESSQWEIDTAQWDEEKFAKQIVEKICAYL